MAVRFDSKPIVARRAYTATIRATIALGWQDQMHHGLHLFFVIAASVVSRSVANQQVLDAAGSAFLGKLYLAVALIAGVTVAAVGWSCRNQRVNLMLSVIHVLVAVTMLGAYWAPETADAAIVKYIVMEINAAVLLLIFGLTLSARMGPREARRLAARVGAGGIVGGLFGGAVLSLLAPIVGSSSLFIFSALMAVAPVFWLPRVVPQHGTRRDASRDRPEVAELSPYGMMVSVTTLLMVASTTLVDFQYRAAAQTMFQADEMTRFFGLVIILAGIIAVVFQLTLLNGLLDRFGLFSTASIMPLGILSAAALFGIYPAVATLVVLKLVDSGANMSVQQATGGLLLAPLNVRARAVWQGRIDGLAKRGGQALIGLFLAAGSFTAQQVVPITIVLCTLWFVCLLFTRRRYINLLSSMLQAPPVGEPELMAYDGATIRYLVNELRTATANRAAVILDLLEQAGEKAPPEVLSRLVAGDEHGIGALVVVEHLREMADANGLEDFAQSKDVRVASNALVALDEVSMPACARQCRSIISDRERGEDIRALASALLAPYDPQARSITVKLATSKDPQTRLCIARALGRMAPGADPELSAILYELAADDESEVARIALGMVGKHVSPEACRVALQATHQREVRGAGMRALAELGAPAVAPVGKALCAALDHPQTASALAWSIGSIGSESGVAYLTEALESPNPTVRLSAAIGLGSLLRRRPDAQLPHQEIQAHYLPEIENYRRLRAYIDIRFSTGAVDQLLRRTLKQRGSTSLEILFRLMALSYPEEAIQAAFVAITSNQRGQRQIALELLDTMLPPGVRQALASAMSGSGGHAPKDYAALLIQLVTNQDPFVADLAASAQQALDPSAHTGPTNAARTEVDMSRTMVNQILELQSLALFSQASAEDLSEVAAVSQERSAPKGAVLYSQGDLGDAMYLIRSGRVTLSRDGELLDELGSGEAVGVVSVLDRLPRPLTATVSESAEMLVLRTSELQQLLADRPLLMHAMFRALTAAIRDQVGLGKRSTADAG